MRELKCTKNVKAKTSKDCEACFNASKSFPTRALCVKCNAKYLDVVEELVAALEPVVVVEEPPKKRKKKK